MFGDLSNSSDLMIETYKEDPEGSTQKVISTDDRYCKELLTRNVHYMKLYF